MSFNVVLYKPEIPSNTGNIGRLCVNSDSILHIVGTPSFDLSEKAVRRAGLDYWKELKLIQHSSWEEFQKGLAIQEKGVSVNIKRIFLVSKFGSKSCYLQDFSDGDYLLFGNETSGIPIVIRNQFDENNILRIPMKEGSRSLNLSNAVAVVLFEAIRQTGILK